MYGLMNAKHRAVCSTSNSLKMFDLNVKYPCDLLKLNIFVCLYFVFCFRRDHSSGREQEGHFYSTKTTQISGLHPEGALLETGERDGPAASVDQVPLFTLTHGLHRTGSRTASASWKLYASGQIFMDQWMSAFKQWHNLCRFFILHYIIEI